MGKIVAMTLAKCELNDFPCVGVDYSSFDDICVKELRGKFRARSIVNESSFCTQIPINKEWQLEHLVTSDYIQSLRGKVGIYHLWLDYDECDDHGMQTMRGIYVGKGFAKDRIKKHINTKDLRSDILYVTFFECGNRISKYLEQLFLDVYRFDLNERENSGTERLFAVWGEERFTHGTELIEIANRYSLRIGPGPFEV